MMQITSKYTSLHRSTRSFVINEQNVKNVLLPTILSHLFTLANTIQSPTLMSKQSFNGLEVVLKA